MNKQTIKYQRELSNGDKDNEKLFERKVPQIEGKKTLLEIPLGCQAIVIRNGANYRYYDSGTYPLFDNKDEYKDWKRGGSVELIYLASDVCVDILWAATDIDMVEVKYGFPIKVGLSGSLGVSIDSPEMFFRKVVGNHQVFDAKAFRERFADIISTEVVDEFVNCVARERWGYEQFYANKKALGITIGKYIDQKLRRDYGLKIEDFIIAEIVVDGIDKIKEEIITRKVMDRYNDPTYEKFVNEQERKDAAQWEKDKYILEQGERHQDKENMLEMARLNAEKEIKIAEINSRQNSTTHTQQSQATKKAMSGSEIFDSLKNRVGEVFCRVKNEAVAGSGFIIGVNEKLFVTNAHVVVDDETLEVFDDIIVYFGEFATNAMVLALGDDQAGCGDGVDLAVLQLEELPANAMKIECCEIENIHNGDMVYCIGNALGQGTCITKGIISDICHGEHGLIMTDCAINHGNSGGPLVNEEGLLVGVVSSGYEGCEGMNFAIPLIQLYDFLKLVIEKNKQNTGD